MGVHHIKFLHLEVNIGSPFVRGEWSRSVISIINDKLHTERMICQATVAIANSPGRSARMDG